MSCGDWLIWWSILECWGVCPEKPGMSLETVREGINIAWPVSAAALQMGRQRGQAWALIRLGFWRLGPVCFPPSLAGHDLRPLQLARTDTGIPPGCVQLLAHHRCSCHTRTRGKGIKGEEQCVQWLLPILFMIRKVYGQLFSSFNFSKVISGPFM